MDRRRARRNSHGTAAHDRWLVSYADFITLMFAFFTVMYAISTVDRDKLEQGVSSLHDAFATREAALGPRRPGGPRVPGVAPPPVQVLEGGVPVAPIMSSAAAAAPKEASLGDVRQRLATELADAVDARRLEIVDDPRGLVLSLPVAATFAVGSADVQPEARELIARIGASLRPLGNALRIEGHTDDVPIHTARYASNWELSTARASAVVAFLITAVEIPPVRLSAAGYGEFHPRVANDTAEHRARNRRVDIVVLNAASRQEEPGTP